MLLNHKTLLVMIIRNIWFQVRIVFLILVFRKTNFSKGEFTCTPHASVFQYRLVEFSGQQQCNVKRDPIAFATIQVRGPAHGGTQARPHDRQARTQHSVWKWCVTLAAGSFFWNRMLLGVLPFPTHNDSYYKKQHLETESKKSFFSLATSTCATVLRDQVWNLNFAKESVVVLKGQIVGICGWRKVLFLLHVKMAVINQGNFTARNCQNVLTCTPKFSIR